MAAAIPDYSKGPPGALRAWCRPSCLIPARIGVDIFFISGYIGGRVQGKGGAGRGDAPTDTVAQGGWGWGCGHRGKHKQHRGGDR